MGNAYLYGNGGSGGASLNFRVLGGTSAPANPKENDIWVNTSAEITSYIFSAAEPETPADGMVWFLVSTFSTVEFNALKKNGIQVYPVSAKQYISGAWVSVETQSYQGGAWVDWVLYLYKDNDEFINITGGWSAVKWASSTYDSVTPELRRLNGYLRAVLTPDGSPSSGVIRLREDIDVTHFNTMYFTCDAEMTGGSAEVAIRLNDRDGDTYTSTVYAKKTLTEDGTKRTVLLDISGVSGPVCICVSLACGSTSTATFRLYKAWLE